MLFPFACGNSAFAPRGPSTSVHRNTLTATKRRTRFTYINDLWHASTEICLQHRPHKQLKEKGGNHGSSTPSSVAYSGPATIGSPKQAFGKGVWSRPFLAARRRALTAWFSSSRRNAGYRTGDSTHAARFDRTSVTNSDSGRTRPPRQRSNFSCVPARDCARACNHYGLQRRPWRDRDSGQLVWRRCYAPG